MAARRKKQTAKAGARRAKRKPAKKKAKKKPKKKPKKKRTAEPRDVTSVSAYIRSVEAARREPFLLLRSLIQRVAPAATESVKSGMLHYDLGGDLFALAARKRYINLYVMRAAALAEHFEPLSGVRHGKSTLRFRKTEDILVPAIRKVLSVAVASAERAS